MRRETVILVVVLLCCLGQLEPVVAAAQEQQPETTVQPGKTTETTKSGAADGKPSPALTGGGQSPISSGVRRPLYRIRKSDVLEIDFTFSPDLNQTVTVQPDGFIALKELGPFYAEGATVPELQQAICQAYTGILHDPVVTVVLKDFDKPYFIAAGEVGHPGKYELRSDTTVAEAVAIAGGVHARL
jgi:protein involved in polysaccharide export with SLBB domain